jgi:hypothetical protein
MQLMATAASLRRTRDDLDSTSHLLRYHKGHGGELLSQAESIRSTLEGSVRDLGGLHGKIGACCSQVASRDRVHVADWRW